MEINTYFKNWKKFKNKIIVISVKDSASKFINKFITKSNIGLKCEISTRESYIAVVDIARDFIYERHSSQKITGSYKIKNKYIDIVSAGYSCGNISSIKVGDEEYSKNKRGLNIAILNKNNFKLIDSFYVDSHADEKLIIKE